MLAVLSHPALASRESRFSYVLIILLRALFFSTIIIALDHTINLGTSVTLILVALCFGIVLGSEVAFSRIRFLGLLAVTALGYLIVAYGIEFLGTLFSSPAHPYFYTFIASLHSSLALWALVFGLISTWCFWRFRHTLTFEALVLTAVVLSLLAPHRNFTFGSPRILNDLAWSFQIDDLTMIILTAATLSLFLLTYLFIATLPSTPTIDAIKSRRTSHKGSLNFVESLSIISCCLFFVYFVSSQLFARYQSLAATRVANGVGQGAEEGSSPLGFHSALGTSNQPTGLVRLEGDYIENPFSPMLYLRESALSKFNGRELVYAGTGYDSDVSNTSPFENFTGSEDPELGSRVPLVQSIYLLSDQKLAFAADYPVSITRLKIPDERFKSAYKAYSIAPGFSLEALDGVPVGDPRWSDDERAHYLVPHGDPRYAETAQKLVGTANTPASKITAIIHFLNKNAIYTLAPGHEVDDSGDPVAPFLFGDLRGYCVHFAHATTYLLRSLGIPARVATGYLTDLSQAKDGHILLRMSDRHAWAEVYFQGYGWIPFDTQPEQVESHAETPVDMSVLEELMGLIGPEEELIPKDILDGEKNIIEEGGSYLPNPEILVALVVLVLLILVISKLILLYPWILPGSIRNEARRSYRALLVRLYDIGVRRRKGETRVEFARRVEKELGHSSSELTQILSRLRFDRPESFTLTEDEVTLAREKDFEAMNSFSLAKKIILFTNPASLFAHFAGRLP